MLSSRAGGPGNTCTPPSLPLVFSRPDQPCTSFYPKGTLVWAGGVNRHPHGPHPTPPRLRTLSCSWRGGAAPITTTPHPLHGTLSTWGGGRGTGGMGGAGLALVSQHGGPIDPPPRAPQCPFSGLSLTMATSCPLPTLELTWKPCQPCPLPSVEPGLTQVPDESPTPKGGIRAPPPSGERPPSGTQGPPRPPPPRPRVQIGCLVTCWARGDRHPSVLRWETLCNTSFLFLQAHLSARGRPQPSGSSPGLWLGLAGRPAGEPSGI